MIFLKKHTSRPQRSSNHNRPIVRFNFSTLERDRSIRLTPILALLESLVALDGVSRGL